MCSRLFIFLYLHYSDCCSDLRTLKTTMVISRSSKCACLQSAACGGLEALYPLRELVIYVPFKTLVL
jgi:hypothetical protein